jgi:hypothetical protein
MKWSPKIMRDHWQIGGIHAIKHVLLGDYYHFGGMRTNHCRRTGGAGTLPGIVLRDRNLSSCK